MMARMLIGFLCILPLFSKGQYTYFSQLTGFQGDLESEQVANIEVVDDGYVVWGGGVNSQGVFHFVRKYNLAGQTVSSNYLVHEGEYVLTGVTNTFKWNPSIEKFVYLHGTNLDNGITEGYLIEFDTNLDTTFTRRYNFYPPYTYPFVLYIDVTGYIVTGEQGGMPNSAGTFMAKLDFEGNVLWNEILQPEVYQHIYRNLNVIKLNDGYLTCGWGRSGWTPFGLLTLTDTEGNTTHVEQFIDPEMPRSNGLLATRLSNNDIFMAQGFGYEWMSEFGNPHVFWNSMQLFKLDEQTLDTINLSSYFDNYEYFTNGANKILATPDGGAIILGGYYGYWYDYNTWMLKVDVNGNEEWFKEYTYETCNDCENILYDIELAPDGGYIAAGYFINWAEDPRSSTWLLKVDACGDTEWQGCAPLSVPERNGQSFAVYPNPSTGRFTVETSTNSRAKSYRVYDLSGRLVEQESLGAAAGSFTIDVHVPSGFYTLQVVLDDGTMEAYKIQVVR